MVTQRGLCGWLGLGAILLALDAAGACRAGSVFDQGFDPTGSITVGASFGGINPNQERAQTFQVGLSGILTEVDVFVHRATSTPTGGNLLFELRRLTTAGAPSNVSADTLLQEAIPSTSVPTSDVFLPVDLSSAHLHVNAGDKLAIVLYAGVGTPKGLAYTWGGENTDPYPRGSDWEQVIGNHSWLNEGASGGDLGFRTFVDAGAVPEPGTLALATFGGLGLLGYVGGRRRFARRGSASRTEILGKTGTGRPQASC